MGRQCELLEGLTRCFILVGIGKAFVSLQENSSITYCQDRKGYQDARFEGRGGDHGLLYLLEPHQCIK